jgi:RNA polymerase sigma-70 factor (ECF subfamily)
MEQKLLEKLYNSYYKEIYLYLYSMCKRKETAEDIVQETFLKALLALPKNHNNLRAWLYMVARNIYLNTYKKEKRIIYTEDISNDIKDNSDEILNSILKLEQSRMLHQALMRLEERKREILVLHYFGGLKLKEIAALMKITTENVKIIIYRGRNELKKSMEENGYDIS